ncbi:hypothetical protein SAMN05660909_02446 [Chitinophaga terrae (ex Kim and Jung 2007)]|uniref:PIN domain-containing protein n=1 Tax=Chitinophaga terrae (ex Kim and Jung 2007) TaxID=408074 RepID=A0A1H4C4D8_9BACT|nr:PIN domain-containing protein [Chitinophaga terrae (ex Kim and Jung 2007)]MDQ0108497.1 putative nucleic acid-binding protein [Chitinophaga terrae (ex Kim and Jung 2007)]GEP92213.1 hypothetical protein CTE07_38580 [Chitinophaga terrae (ex Kim and Jung 2007)]SEA55197.1 hypothetical protein SAMN05660909_02446 [Chitinophaga terrae (ex Kim and Jung 2007)]
MKSTLVVTDACIFIDLFDLDLVKFFFYLEIDTHTTSAVYFELYSEQRDALEMYRKNKKLSIHNLTENDLLEIYGASYPKSLSETDKSVLHLARKLKAGILSSDKVVRNYAKSQQIEYHGMLWVFDKLVDMNILSPNNAMLKLNQLVACNFTFRNNQLLIDEIQKRLKRWNTPTTSSGTPFPGIE